MKKLLNILISVELCLWLLALVCAALAAGSFQLTGDYAASINAMPLFAWLMETPLLQSWWLWLTVALLALLVLNTILCSLDTLRSRWGRAGIVPVLSPQLIHAGFLLIVAAHLISALGGRSYALEVYEGVVASLPDGRQFGVAVISATMSPRGMPLGFNAELVPDPYTRSQRTTISPNHPWFSGAYGVYVKQAELYPYKRALLEIHREPGAGMALAGALLFSAGNVLLLWGRSTAKETSV